MPKTKPTCLLSVVTAALLVGCGTDERQPKRSQQASAAPSPVAATSTKKAEKNSAARTSEVGATELTRLEHLGLVIQYQGFTEEQMKAYLAHMLKYYGGKGKTFVRDGRWGYQVKLAQVGKGMKIVREDDFTRIWFPIEEKGGKDRLHFGTLAIPLCHSLIKIDESVRGKVAYAFCNDDCTVVYLATDDFHDGKRPAKTGRTEPAPTDTKGSINVSEMTVEQVRQALEKKGYIPKATFFKKYGQPEKAEHDGDSVILYYPCKDGTARIECDPFQYRDGQVYPKRVRKSR